MPCSGRASETNGPAANPSWVNFETLDGDHLDIDFTPANYTPDASPGEAADVDDLAAHLKGIDNELTDNAIARMVEAMLYG